MELEPRQAVYSLEKSGRLPYNFSLAFLFKIETLEKNFRGIINLLA